MANGLLLKNGLIVTGSVEVQSTVSASSFSGDGSGLSGVSDFPYTGSAVISGSLKITGSITTTDNITIPRGKSLIFQSSPTLAGGVSIGDGFTTDNVGANFIRIGNYAGTEASSNKFIAIGDEAGRSATGQQQIFIGFRAGRGFDNSDNVVVIGNFAAWGDYSNADVDNAVILGTNAGRSVTQTDNIVIIGTNAGYNTEYSSKSVIIGDQAGYNHSGSSGDTKEGNVFIGYQAGYNELGSNQLIIANNSSSALVTGDFANNTFNISGSVSASTYYGDGSNLTGISSDPFPYTGDVEITGSNSLSGNYALKVTNTSGADILKAENDGKLYLRNPSHTSGDINSTGSIVHYGDLTLGPITSNAPDRKLTIAGYDGAQVEFNLHNGWGKPTIEAHYGGTIKYINYGNNSTNLNFQFGESATRQGSMRFYTNSDEAIKFGTNTGYPLAYIGVVEQPNNYNGGLVIKSRNGTTQINTWTFGRYGDLDAPGNISASGHVSASTYYGDGSNLTNLPGGDPFPYTGSAIISGSLSLEGSGSTIFDVVGSQGQLFSITDSLSGSLFAVSDVSGLPILEVFSNDTVKMGSFNNEALEISGSDVNFNNLPTSDPGVSGRLFQTGSDAIGTTAGTQLVCISQG